MYIIVNFENKRNILERMRCILLGTKTEHFGENEVYFVRNFKIFLEKSWKHFSLLDKHELMIYLNCKTPLEVWSGRSETQTERFIFIGYVKCMKGISCGGWNLMRLDALLVWRYIQ